MRRVAFLSLTPGAGKSMLIYHLAWMLAELGETVLVVDLDPQVHVTSLIVAEERLEILWTGGEHPYSICGALRSVSRGMDVLGPHVEREGSKIGVVAGDPALAGLEGSFSEAWIRCEAGDPRTFSAVTAVDRAVRRATEEFGATWVLIDTAPNLGAITRSALIASDSVVIPLAPDLYAYQGLLTLGPTLRAWQSRWAELQRNHPDARIQPPAAEPLGYVVMPHGMKESRPAKAYQRWIYRFPAAYRESVLDLVAPGLPASADEDVHCLAVLKHYRSLLPMALKARKPAFALTPADGAIGAHADAAKLAHFEFAALAQRLADASILPR